MVSFPKLGFVAAIKAHAAVDRRHGVDIPMINVHAPPGYRGNRPWLVDTDVLFIAQFTGIVNREGRQRTCKVPESGIKAPMEKRSSGTPDMCEAMATDTPICDRCRRALALMRT